MEKWTGERLETRIYNETTAEHLHRYGCVLPLIAGKDVLDVASGTGYGANLMASRAHTVVGVDICRSAVDQANRLYVKKNLKYLCGAAEAIPLPDASVDVVTSFETIEHHEKHEEMMLEVKRVLRPGGVLVISSPEKLFFARFNIEFHVKELYLAELKALIGRHFQNAEYYLQKTVMGSILLPEADPRGFRFYSGDYDSIRESESFEQPAFNVCIASDASLPSFTPSYFDGASYISSSIRDNVKTSRYYRAGWYLLYPLTVLKNLIRGREPR